MSSKLIALFLLSVVLQGCSTVSVKEGVTYSHQERSHLYHLKNWSFQGRLALSGQDESWTANINWKHISGEDRLLLSGPLSQGSVSIVIDNSRISIDQGDGRIEYSDNPDDLVRKRLGIYVPIMALRYWVVGLTLPGSRFEQLDDGFLQSGWGVHYSQFVVADNELMPRKMRVENDKIKLKLIVDQWEIDG